jgi:bisphosphoglycerate-dependent phosphoglycerate mutase
VIANLNIPTSVPLVYQLQEGADGSLTPVKQVASCLEV